MAVATIDALDRWLSPAEAGALAGVSYKTISRAADRGAVVCVRLRGDRFLDRESVERYARQRQEQSER